MARPERYRVALSPAAHRDLRKLPARTRTQMVELLAGLANEPRPKGCRKIQGDATAFRIRLGHHRVIYDVLDKERRVEVLRVLRRTETTYRRLS